MHSIRRFNTMSICNYASITALLVAATLLGCNVLAKNFGQTDFSAAAETNLKQVIDNPKQFDGQMIILNGVLTAQCAALCDFTFKQDTVSTTVFVQGFKPPRIKIGTPMKVFAQVTGNGERTIINALGISILK